MRVFNLGSGNNISNTVICRTNAGCRGKGFCAGNNQILNIATATSALSRTLRGTCTTMRGVSFRNTRCERSVNGAGWCVGDRSLQTTLFFDLRFWSTILVYRGS